VKIRIWGPPEENARVTEVLRAAFTVVDESEDYPPNRGTSPLRRRYLELRLDTPATAAVPPSPLELAEAAKRARNLSAELSVLTDAGHDLEAQPWYPLRSGDVVLTYLPDSALTGGPLSETYLAVDDGFEVRLRQVASSTAASDPVDVVDVTDTCGDCVEGRCHWGGEKSRAGVAAVAADPKSDWPCGRARHEVSYRYRTQQLAIFDDEETDGDQDDAEAPGGELLASIWDLWFEWGQAAITVIRAGVVVHGTPQRQTD
jgi:hypothetical protein